MSIPEKKIVTMVIATKTKEFVYWYSYLTDTYLVQRLEKMRITVGLAPLISMSFHM